MERENSISLNVQQLRAWLFKQRKIYDMIATRDKTRLEHMKVIIRRKNDNKIGFWLLKKALKQPF